MNILKDVLSELFSMFVADARLTAAILATRPVCHPLQAACSCFWAASLSCSSALDGKPGAGHHHSRILFDLCRRVLRVQGADPNVGSFCGCSLLSV
jgi:hypothetical protein